MGVFDTSRASTTNIASGTVNEEARQAFLTNFAGAAYATSPTLTPEFLNGVDMVAVCSTDTEDAGISPLSASEQTALFEFVQGGGTAFLIAEGFTPHLAAAQSIVAPFGVTIEDDGMSDILVAAPTNPAHPIFDGPFGVAPPIPILGTGIFTDLGPYATPLARLQIGRQPALAVIEAGVIAPGSGRVVIIGDGSPFVDTADGGFSRYTETMLLNTLAYLAPVPEPSGRVLGGMAVAGLVAVVRTRRCRRV
ncbi:MAG: hypothetical protein DWQ37_10030 [Planctomycetota bacterium]|nr:MAG: hypothetical protein DWQ37_10030 [Planctomycetota bacterium]